MLTTLYLLLMQKISFNNLKKTYCITLNVVRTLVTKVEKHFVIWVQRKETFKSKGPSFIDFIQYFLS